MGYCRADPLYGSIAGRTEWERGKCQNAGTARGGRCMSGFVVARRRYDSQIARRVSGWERYYLRRAAPADIACAIRSLARAQSCSGSATIPASPQPGARPGRRPRDELPQLSKVLPGDMPPVEPLPALPDEAAKYVGHIRAGADQWAVRRSGVYAQMPADRAVGTASQR